MEEKAQDKILCFFILVSMVIDLVIHRAIEICITILESMGNGLSTTSVGF